MHQLLAICVLRGESKCKLLHTAGVLSKDEIEKGWSDLDKDHDGEVPPTLQNIMLFIILCLRPSSCLIGLINRQRFGNFQSQSHTDRIDTESVTF